ncbi:hypothetical protein GYH30_005395 [Glycine max]|nr:hypothetical protein GYH30_005395 [Glycine max]
MDTLNGPLTNVLLALPTTPYLGSIRFNVNGAFDPKSPPDNFSENYDISKPPLNPNSNVGSGVYMFQFNQVVDVILQNANVMKGENSEIHPWHLHGHDFWVLGYGDGRL